MDLGFAQVDTSRAARCGLPEVVFGSGKTPEQIVEISRALLSAGQPVLVTRASAEAGAMMCEVFPGAQYDKVARVAWVGEMNASGGHLALCCAGTADLPVAEEAAFCARFWGHQVDRHYDVGVAGLHRLLARIERIREAEVIIAVAGMEGALPSVIAGLVERPVIAVPTSIGYGANLSGLTALCGMLTSCGSGVTVVNIDNGFGAAYAATQIIRLVHPR